MSFLAPPAPKAIRPSGFNLNQTSNANEGFPAAWWRGWGRIPYVWVTDGESAIENDGFWFVDAVAVVGRTIIDDVRAVYLDDFPVPVSSVGDDYADFSATELGEAFREEITFRRGPITNTTTTGVGSIIRLHLGKRGRTAEKLVELSGMNYSLPEGCAVFEARRLKMPFQSPDRMPNYEVLAGAACRPPTPFIEAGLPVDLADKGVNPISACVDLLCDARNGAGWSHRRFDIPAIVAKAQELSADKYRINPTFSTRRGGERWLKEILRYFDGFTRRVSGLWQISFEPHENLDLGEPDGGIVATFDYHQFTRPPKISIEGEETRPTAAIGTYTELENDGYEGTKEVAITARSILSRARRVSAEDPLDVDLTAKNNGDDAKEILTRALAYEAAGIVSAQMWVRKEFSYHNGQRIGRGDHLWLVDTIGGRSFAMRVLTRSESYGSGEVSFKLELARGHYPVPYIPPAQSVPVYEPPEVPDLGEVQLIEMPWAAHRSEGGAVAILVERANMGVSSVAVWTSSNDTTFGDRQLGVFNTWADKGSLVGAIDETAGVIDVDLSASTIQSLSVVSADEQAADYLLAFIGPTSGDWSNGTFEILSLSTETTISPGVYRFDVLRGRLGSLAKAFTDGAPVWIARRSEVPMFRSEIFGPAVTSYYKLQPMNYYRVKELTLVAVLSLTQAAAAFDSPQITIDSPLNNGIGGATVTGLVGEPVYLEFEATDAGGNLRTLEIYANTFSSESSSYTNTKLVAKSEHDGVVTSAVLSGEFIPSAEEAGRLVLYQFVAIDERGQSSRTFQVLLQSVESLPVPGPVAWVQYTREYRYAFGLQRFAEYAAASHFISRKLNTESEWEEPINLTATTPGVSLGQTVDYYQDKLGEWDVRFGLLLGDGTKVYSSSLPLKYLIEKPPVPGIAAASPSGYTITWSKPGSVDTTYPDNVTWVEIEMNQTSGGSWSDTVKGWIDFPNYVTPAIGAGDIEVRYRFVDTNGNFGDWSDWATSS